MKKIAIVLLGLLVGVGAASANYQSNSYTYSGNYYNNCYNISRNLKRGDTDSSYSDNVAKLQNALAYRGYFNGQITGYFGYVTQSAVIGFQRDNGISTTGYVGPQTRSAIYNVSCGGVVVNPVPTVCTAEARLCSDGSMMPRDADCTWHADRCPAYNGGSGSIVNTCPINSTIYNNTCVCPIGYNAQYNINGFTCALNQNNNSNNYNYNNNICSVNTSIYIGVNCTCPAGSVMQYNSNSVLTGNTTFTCNSNGNGVGTMTLSPSALPSVVYSLDQYNSKPLQGFMFSVSNISNTSTYYNSLANITLSLVNSNLPNASINKSDCNRTSSNGVMYYNANDPVTLIYCPDSNIFVSLNTANMINGQSYYFTVRVSSGGVNTDTNYSFVYRTSQNSTTSCPLTGPFLDSSYTGCTCPSGYSKIQSYDIIGLSTLVYKCN